MLKKKEYHIMSIVIIIVIKSLGVGLWSGCKDIGTEVKFLTQQVNEDHSNIADPYTRWQAYNLRNYVMEQQISCFYLYSSDVCRIYVRDNKVVDVIKKSDGISIFTQVPERYKTVEELFVLANSFNPDSVASLVIQYDERFGLPKLISVDYSEQIAGDEVAYYSQNIKRLLN